MIFLNVGQSFWKKNVLLFSKIIETIHIDSKRKNGFVSDK